LGEIVNAQFYQLAATGRQQVSKSDGPPSFSGLKSTVADGFSVNLGIKQEDPPYNGNNTRIDVHY
jgi:hypothetical protein